MSHPSPTTAAAFFESYRAAFERADAAAILEHFAFPCHMTSEGREVTLTPLASPQDGELLVVQLLERYQRIGVATARVLDVAASEISPRLIQALVHWAVIDAAGQILYVFEAAYTLASVGGALRISAIAHNEIPRFQEYLARIGPQGSSSTPG